MSQSRRVLMISKCCAGTLTDAETLLTSAENDFRKGKVANMMKTVDGRALLEQLLAKLAVEMAPAISRAGAILAQMGSRVPREAASLCCALARTEIQAAPFAGLKCEGLRSTEVELAHMLDQSAMHMEVPLDCQLEALSAQQQALSARCPVSDVFDISKIFADDVD